MPQSERYYRAARYPNESSSEAPYNQIQVLLFAANSDLSAYRFWLDNDLYIVVVGDQPHEDLNHQLEQALATGQAAELESATLDVLFRRREDSRIHGGWIELHYSPGLQVWLTGFELGRVVMTRGVQAALERHPEGRGLEELRSLILDRHAQGDWGALGDEDKRLNDEALEHGDRLLSVYYLPDGTETGARIYIITEADRSATTALLPDEY